MTGGKIFHIAVSALILAFSIILYSPTVHYQMVWDDYELLVNEPMADGRENWTHAFFKPVDRLYRPLRTLSYFATRSIANVPSGHHVLNIGLFAVTVLSAYWFLFILTGNPVFAAAASFLYMLHPVNAEIVPWITGGRANLLAGPLMFSSLALYLTARNRMSGPVRSLLFFMSYFSCLAAFFSKESALIVPLLIVLIEMLFPADPSSGFKSRFLKILSSSSPFMVLGLAFFILRTQVLSGTAQVSQHHGGSLYVTVSSILPVLADYLRITFFPHNLCAIYTPDIHKSILEAAPLVSLAVLSSLFAAALVFAVRSPILSFSVIWFFICLLPASNIIPIAALKANRLAGEAILSGCMIYAHLSLLPLGNRKSNMIKSATAVLLFSIPAAFFIIQTRNFMGVWRDNLTLWTASAECAPESETAYNNLGAAYFNAGRIPEAIQAMERARDLNPSFVSIRKNLGDLYAMQGRYARALEEFKAAYFYNPAPETAIKIGIIYSKMGDRDSAIDFLDKAVNGGVPADAKNTLLKTLEELKRRSN